MKTLLMFIIVITSASAWAARVANNTFVQGRIYAPLTNEIIKPAMEMSTASIVSEEPVASNPILESVAESVVRPTEEAMVVKPSVENARVGPIVVPPVAAPPRAVVKPIVPAPVLPVVTATPEVSKPAVVESSAPRTSIRPKSRPSSISAIAPTDAGPTESETVTSSPDPASRTTPVINDLPNCRYRVDCWKDVALHDEIKKIVANIRYINTLQDTKIDPRYILCTGYRESTFNPGAVSSSNAKGIFQVIPSTGKAALRLGSKLQGFSGKSWTQYAEAMVHSSLAQTEISLLVLKMKVREGASSRILAGTASVADYKELAWRYVGKTGASYSINYRDHITNCFSCLRGISDSNINSGEPSSTIQNCLKKAK